MLPEDTNLELAIQFARHSFDNLQTLNRASDTKAGVMVTIMVFLAATALTVSKDAIAKLRLHPCPVAVSSVVFVLASAGLLASVLWTFVAVHRVLRPRGARYTVAQKGQDIMWQDHILLHENNEVYFSAVRAATPELILRNLTNQVFELANISKEKMEALARTRWVALLGFWSWVLTIASGLALTRY
jgi:hypothetical protein